MNNATIATPDSADTFREVERLRSDLRQLRSDVTALAQDSLGAARAGAIEARERLGRLSSAAATRGRESVETLEKEVVDHPLRSVGLALAVGILVGAGACVIARRAR